MQKKGGKEGGRGLGSVLGGWSRAEEKRVGT